jgi:hypothetical protein
VFCGFRGIAEPAAIIARAAMTNPSFRISAPREDDTPRFVGAYLAH